MLLSKHMQAALISCKPYLVTSHSFSTPTVDKFGANVSQSYVLDGKMCKFVGSMVEWLRHIAYDQHSLGSKPTCTILLCFWKDTL